MTNNSSTKKLNHIDSIRGIAILMVISVHVAHSMTFVGMKLGKIEWLLTEYGHMGVQLFFVASAYTLCLSSENRENETNKNLKFFIRRFFRIAPAYYLIGILLYFVLAFLSGRNVITSIENYTLTNVLANLFFINGFYPPANNNIVPGGWSIGTEMAFYLIFPFLFYYIKRINKLNYKYLFGCFILMVIVSLTISSILFKNNHDIGLNSFLYYNLYNQLPVFFIGIMYYFSEKQNIFNYNRIYDVIAFCFFSAISLSLWALQIDYLFSIIPIISAISFVFLVNIFKKFKNINISILIRIGTLSYSMYLIHWLFARLISLFILIKLIKPNTNGVLIFVGLFIMSVICTFFISILSEKYIEKPFMRFGKRIINNL